MNKAHNSLMVFNEEDYRIMGDTVPYGVWMSDASGKSLYVSQSFLDLVGMSWDEYQRRGFSHRLHPDDLEADRTDWRLCLQTGKPRDFERRILAPDGTYRHVLTRGMPVRDDDGHIIKWVGINLDIDRRKKVEEENRHLLEEIEREKVRMMNIIDHVPGVVWEVWGRPSSIGLCATYVSDYIERLTGYPASTWVKDCRFLTKITHPDDAARTFAQFEDLFNSRKNGKIEFRIINRDGKVVWVEVQCNVICNKQGEAMGMRGVAIDITQRKIESEQKDEFLSVASHELKTPVTSIRGFTQILDRDLDTMSTEQVRHYLRKVNRYVDHLVDLVTELLDSSKIQAGKLKLREDHFNLGALIKEAVDDLQVTTIRHSINVEVPSWALVKGDRDRLLQVLINLMSNAIKYSPNANRIDVRAEVRGPEVVVSVQDYGVGIPKPKLEHVFERYYRVHDANMAFAGLGIGLYIVKQLIDSHGGQIWVESKEREGSTFYFKLPIISPRT